jgi:membrane protease YdiL (CAAX protease family)
MTPLAAAGWTGVFFVSTLAAAVFTERAHPGAQNDVVNRGMYMLLAASLTIFLILRFHSPESSLRATVGWRPIGPLEALLSIVAGVGLYPGLAALTARIVARWPYSDEERQLLDKLNDTPNLPTRVALVMVAIVIVPIALELLFRGMIYGELAKGYPAYVAAGVSTLCYALVQVELRQLPLALVLALSMAWLRECTGSVIAPILGVVAFGAVEGIPVLRGQEDVVYSQSAIWGGVVVAALALAVLRLGRRGEAEE